MIMKESEVFKSLMDGSFNNESINKSPAFQLYVEKFLVGTIGFDASCIGAYILLLSHQWDLYHLPNNTEELMEFARCNEKELQRVLKKFTLCSDGFYRNSKLERIRAAQICKREVRTKAGKFGAEMRWKKEDEETPSPQQIITPTPKNDAQGYFFYIGQELYKFKISHYIKNKLALFLEQWSMQHKNVDVTTILNTLDKENVGQMFSNERHIQNLFKKTASELQKKNEQPNKSTTATKASIPTPVKRQ